MSRFPTLNAKHETPGKKSARILELEDRLWKKFYRHSPVRRILSVLISYWPLGQYMLKKFGWRSWYTFWYTKLFVADEGGELALLNPLYNKWPGLLKKPFKLEMEHTTICNKTCFFCEHTWWQEKQERITFDWFKKITDPVPTLKWMNITGEGSTFLNKEFMQIIEYMRLEKGCNINFVDEMDFMTEDIARRVVEIGINSIYVSFDGASKQAYEDMKGGCDYDKALENIRTLVRIKNELNSPFPILHFRFIITRKNYHEMPAFMDLMHSIENRGVLARVEFVGLLTFPGIEDQYIPINEIAEDIIVETYEKALEYDINLRFAHEGALPEMSRCAAWVEPYIMIGGEVISCCAILMSNKRKILRDNSFGNVYQTPFLEIWNSDRYKNFRKQVVNPTAKVPASCYGCRAYDTETRAQKYGINDLIVKDEIEENIKGIPVQHMGKTIEFKKMEINTDNLSNSNAGNEK